MYTRLFLLPFARRKKIYLSRRRAMPARYCRDIYPPRNATVMARNEKRKRRNGYLFLDFSFLLFRLPVDDVFLSSMYPGIKFGRRSYDILDLRFSLLTVRLILPISPLLKNGHDGYEARMENRTCEQYCYSILAKMSALVVTRNSQRTVCPIRESPIRRERLLAAAAQRQAGFSMCTS